MMKKWQKQFVIIGVLGAITAVYLNGTRVQKNRIPGLTPGGYLMDLGYFAPTGSFNQFFFGAPQAGSMSGYLSLMSEYDMKRNYGLLDVHGDYQYMGQFSSMAQGAFGSMQSYQMRTHGKKFGIAVSDIIGLDSLRKSGSPLLLVGVIAAAYSGKRLQYKLSSDLAMESQTSMSQNKIEGQYFGWRSLAMEASAGASYSANGQSAEINLQKKIAKDISLNYGVGQQNHSVGVSYSAGF